MSASYQPVSTGATGEGNRCSKNQRGYAGRGGWRHISDTGWHCGTDGVSHRPPETKKSIFRKKKSHILTDIHGATIWTSDAFVGSIHDFSILKQSILKLKGLGLFEAMIKKNPGLKIKLYTNLGFVGIEKILPGIISSRSRSKHEKHNARINKTRIKVKQSIKISTRLSDIYLGTIYMKSFRWLVP